MKGKRLLPALVAGMLVLLLACDDRGYRINRDQAPTRSLAEIRESGTLVVATRNAPTTWYIDRDDEPAGPEYELVRAFAGWLGVEPEFVFGGTVSEILDMIERGEADLAAAGLTITDERRDRFRFGPAYLEVTQQLVCRRDRPQPESLEDLPGLEIHVIADSSYTERLRELRDAQLPELEWHETDELVTEQLLEAVWLREIECTIADSNIVDINRRYFPELSAPVNLTREQYLGWVMPQPRDDLGRAVGEWLAAYREQGRLDHWHDRNFGFVEVFDYVDTRVYIRRIGERLRHYQPWFEQAGERYGIPWTLLAAQAYQESHWRADAVSPTGVRGIMMLTQRTAQHMDVNNRLDPRQSIFGGARYLEWMRERFPEELEEPDRTWIALAAYNVGLSHVRDAQKLAREFGLDPYQWRDLREVLPLLADPDYYHDLPHGYARGHEPVRYVERIRDYQFILENELRRQ